MRRAIANAVVGDAQKREDPTVNALEERVADSSVRRRRFSVPTATMANQIALGSRRTGRRGRRGGWGARVPLRSRWARRHSGLAMKAIQGARGVFSAEQVIASISQDGPYFAPTRILCLENTSNGGGGNVWPIDDLRQTVRAGRDSGLVVHLDGSRLLNASVASGVPPDEIGREFDTVTLCLSKGLGCPLGALLAGSTDRIAKARRLKHVFGGAMRQAGIVAAAGIYALDHNVDRLADDHANATRLAEGLADAGLPVDPAEVETNFVLLDATAMGMTVPEATGPLRVAGRSPFRRRPQGISSSGHAPRRLPRRHRARDRGSIPRARTDRRAGLSYR